MKIKITILTCLLSLISFAQEENTTTQEEITTSETLDLEKAIQNPIASMISLPFQSNTDFNIGPDDRTRSVLNIQPVVPVSLGENTKLIVRTIIPVVLTQPTYGVNGEDSQSGLGDIGMSLYFTPAKTGKIIWGVGPALGFPTATDEKLGTQKWSAGPSFIGLVQPKGWTMGFIVQNTWSYAGNSDRADVNLFYSQVFITKNLPNQWYVNTAPIITSNWEAPSGQQWTVPLGAGVGRLFFIGKMPFNGQVGYYNHVVAPDNGPEWQLRVQLNLLFPQGKK